MLKEYFAKLTSNSPFFFAILDDEHHYCMVNDRYCDVAGLTHSDLVGMNDLQILGERFYNQLKPYYDRALQGESIEAEVTLDESDVESSLHFSVSPILNDGVIEYIVFHAIDTSEKQILTRSLEESESKFLKLSQLIPDGLILVEDDCILSANPASARLFGYAKSTDLLGESLNRLLSNEKNNNRVQLDLANIVNGTPLHFLTSEYCGTQRRLSLHVDDANLFGNSAHLVLIQDMDEKPNPVAQNSNEDVNIDTLTKLYNRLGFTRCLDHFIQDKTPLVMLYLDIDNFKNINDSLGHHIGDRVIQEVSSRLKRHLPQQSVLAHLGGDEFGIILPEPESNSTVEMLAENIIGLINQPFDLHHFSKRLACSIGSVHYPNDGNDARILLQNADTAMYDAKQSGRNCFRIQSLLDRSEQLINKGVSKLRFSHWLLQKEVIDADTLLKFMQNLTPAKIVLGQLAIQQGLLTQQQVDQVLKRQLNTNELFGQAAISLDFISAEQIIELLAIQKENPWEIAAELVRKFIITPLESRKLLEEYQQELQFLQFKEESGKSNS